MLESRNESARRAGQARWQRFFRKTQLQLLQKRLPFNAASLLAKALWKLQSPKVLQRKDRVQFMDHMNRARAAMALDAALDAPSGAKPEEWLAWARGAVAGTIANRAHKDLPELDLSGLVLGCGRCRWTTSGCELCYKKELRRLDMAQALVQP